MMTSHVMHLSVAPIVTTSTTTSHPVHTSTLGAPATRSPAYRDERHVVHDWHHHHLPEPPRGQRWVKVDDKFVLIAVATGIIVSVLAAH
ncbi:RcnB family protein [Modicisalibacter luteus]|uniref:RcnB family protein n=1 Tax=Modicisalibacter luteus TaxID=453962 RepID=UPI0036307EB3